MSGGTVTPRRRLSLDDDSGQIMLLAMVYAAIAVALTLVVVSASAIHLERKRLLEVADSAALDAADEVDRARYFDGGVTLGAVPLSDQSVRDSVEEHLVRRRAHGEFDSLTVGPQTGTSDGRTAEVTLFATVEPPLVGWAIAGFSDGITLHATAAARVDIG